MKKLLWIGTDVHNVYKGWFKLFSLYYDLDIYSFGKDKELKNLKALKEKKGFTTNSSYFNIYEVPNTSEYDYIIVGDVFTNNLAYRIRGDNVVYYSEFFMYKKSFYKKVIFYIISLLFFRNKKILVPTTLARETFSKISNNVYYLPALYSDNLYLNKRILKNKVSLLFVGKISNGYKNTDFMIRNYLEMKKTNDNIILSLVGNILDSDFLEKYGEYLENGTLIYYSFLEKDYLREIYNKNDILILPSRSEAIGAVIQEAMASSLAILASDTVGASSYIRDSYNSCVFETDNSKEFREKLNKIIVNLDEYKMNSYKLMEENYSLNNKDLADRIGEDFCNYLSVAS